MPKLSADTLLQRALWPATQDRESFAEAYGGEGEMADEARGDAQRIQAMVGKSFKNLTEAERETARLAFLYAEQWETGLAEAQGRGNHQEREACEQAARLFRDFRLKEWGKTVLETQLEKATSVNIIDLIRTQNTRRRSP